MINTHIDDVYYIISEKAIFIKFICLKTFITLVEIVITINIVIVIGSLNKNDFD